MFLLHDCKIIHWASPNQSPTRSPCALGFVYCGISAKSDEEIKWAYQARLDAELKAANKI